MIPSKEGVSFSSRGCRARPVKRTVELGAEERPPVERVEGELVPNVLVKVEQFREEAGGELFEERELEHPGCGRGWRQQRLGSRLATVP